MTHLPDVHEGHGATFSDRGGRQVVAHYGNPARVHRAVRTVVGVIEYGYGVLTVEGVDRNGLLSRQLTHTAPSADGKGVYALSLTPQGTVEADLYAFNAGDRFLVFTPPGRAEDVAQSWRGASDGDVTITVATDQFATFGVHGPKATEKVASVFSTTTPDEPLTFARGSMDRAGVTVIRTDAPTGEEGYDVVCAADAARDVFDTLENRGLNAAPFGYRTWESLTLEAGTPLFETELAGRHAGDLGLRNAVDEEESVADTNRHSTEPRKSDRQLVGLETDAVVESADAVLAGDDRVGEITRGALGPTRDAPLALALVDGTIDASLGVRTRDEIVDARRVDLPFVEGSDRSVRVPTY